jgi:CheY-like chemotaxis protein
MPKILIVDDDAVVLLLYKNVLTKSGYELATATDAATGIALMASEKPDLVFMDVMMPGMDGMAALRELRNSGTAYCPVVVITGKNVREYEATRHEAKFVGAAGFLTKPFSPAQLMAEVRRHLPDPAPEQPETI